MNTLANSCFQYDGSDDSKNIIRIMNKNHRGNFTGNDKYFYWIANNIADTFYKMDKDLTEIPPYDYLALLTGKQLTEGDLIVGNRFECIESDEPSFTVNKIYSCNKEKTIDSNISGCNPMNTPYLNRHFKLLPTQESVKDGSLGIEFTEQAQSAFDHYQYPSLINTLDTSAAFWIGWRQAEIFFSTQQTAHLQQQLKEAKELLEESFPIIQAAITLLRVAPNNNTLPEPPHDVIKLVKSINQFLTRNK